MSQTAIAGSHLRVRTHAARRFPVEPATRLQVTIVLHPRDPRAHIIPGVHSARSGANLKNSDEISTRALTDRYDPGDARFARIHAFAAHHQLQVVESSRERHDVIVSGTVAQLAPAFGVVLQHERYEQRIHRVHDGPIRLPNDLAEIVDGVLGLDSLPFGDPQSSTRRAASRITPSEIARHYAFPRTGARRRRIALLQFGGGYSLTDVHAFAKLHGLAVPPIRDRFVVGSDGTIGTNAAPNRATMRSLARAWRTTATFQELFAKYGSSLGEFLESFEVTMDVELAAAFGGGASIDVLFAPPGADGWRRALYAALGHPYAHESVFRGKDRIRLPNVLSISWGECERDMGAMKLRLIDHALTAVARTGIIVCASSGDRGTANTSRVCTGMNVNFPASSPVVIAVGGTQLTPRADGFEETVWKGELKGGGVASGGGMSGVFAQPHYQKSLKVPDATEAWRDESAPPKFAGRWLPDIAAVAGFESNVSLVVGGARLAAGGTSAATPLVAALLARAGRLKRPIHMWLYSRGARAACRDIVDGDNDACAGALPFFHATTGWDACTGWGALIGSRAIRQLREERSRGAR